MASIEQFLKEKEEAGLLRTLKPITSRHQGSIYVKGREYIDFSSNDYLGLSSHPKLIEANKQATDEFGTSSTASRLLSGDLDLHHQLEKEVAAFKHKEAALVFNSGYQANVGILSALYGRDDCIFSDRLNHASIIDGIALSGAKLFRFQHNDAGHLKSLLAEERGKFKNALIISETIFSMDGDRCPLKDLVDLKNQYNCQFMVDEAHATGIFGKNGAGVVEEEGLEQEVDLVMGTFGKALGSFGAYLAASQVVVDYLVNTCRSFVYSTALPPGVIAANRAGIEVVRDEPFRRQNLLECAEYFRDRLHQKGFMARGNSQIIPVVIGDNSKTVAYANKLLEKGYWVLPIRPPTVPQGQARLRFSLTFCHTKEVLDQLIDDISAITI